MNAYNTLRLQKSRHPEHPSTGRTEASVLQERFFLDWIVDGQSLKQLLSMEGHFLEQRVTLLGGFNRRTTRSFLLKLKRFQPSLPVSREELYVCSFCGDLGCSSLTVQMQWTEDAVIWKNFAHQSHPDEWTVLQQSPELRFEKSKYFQAFYGTSLLFGDG